jgi:hypothetical protein
MTLIERISQSSSKQLLAIDGAVFATSSRFKFCSKKEGLFKLKAEGDSFRLADYISGTGTGTVIAAGLSIGLPSATS